MITPNSHMNPVYGKEEIQSVTDYLNSGGWIMEHTKTRELEQMICDYTGAKYAHMVPSATAGLLIAAMLANIKQGEQVAVSAWTQAATINGAVSIGAAPHIFDIDINGVINFKLIPDYIKTIFVTSINGRYSPDTVANINRLKAAGVFVIEDAAQSLGSFTPEGHIGTFGSVGVFSFGAPKIITTGQGGCIVTNDKTISERIVEIKNFGRSMGVTGETYNSHGLNFKFTDLQAAFGIEQMRKLPDIVKRKKRIYEIYRQELSEWVEFIETDLKYTTPTYPDIYVFMHDREFIIELLTNNNMGSRLVYNSLSAQPYHNRWARPTPITDNYARKGLQLPAQANMTDDDVMQVVDVVKGYYVRKKYNPANNELLTTIKEIAFKQTDKLCFVLAGQPRYIGTKIWEENFVNMLKETIAEHPVDIDITYVLPEFDSIDKGIWGREHSAPGLPVNFILNEDLDIIPLQNFFYTRNKTSKQGKIKIKKEKIETYLREKLNFVSNIEFVYYDPYEFVNEVQQLLNFDAKQNADLYNVTDEFNADLDHVTWLSQHLSPRIAYNARQEFFDSLPDSTPIIKMRNDYYFSDSLLTSYQWVTLWNLIAIYVEGFVATGSSILRNNETAKKTPAGPMVIYEAYCPEIVYGKLFSADFYHVFNKDGFKVYVEEFFDWMSEDIIERGGGLMSETHFKDEYKSYKKPQRKRTRIPEIIINDFFMEKEFFMKYSGMYNNFLCYHEGTLIRNKATESDLYRYMWYEWTDEMINQLKNIVNRSIYFD